MQSIERNFVGHKYYFIPQRWLSIYLYSVRKKNKVRCTNTFWGHCMYNSHQVGLIGAENQRRKHVLDRPIHLVSRIVKQFTGRLYTYVCSSHISVSKRVKAYTYMCFTSEGLSYKLGQPAKSNVSSLVDNDYHWIRLFYWIYEISYDKCPLVQYFVAGHALYIYGWDNYIHICRVSLNCGNSR